MGIEIVDIAMIALIYEGEEEDEVTEEETLEEDEDEEAPKPSRSPDQVMREIEDEISKIEEEIALFFQERREAS